MNSPTMLSIALQILHLASFLALLVFIWRLSMRPNRRIRAVFYGWGWIVLLEILWALILPVLFHGLIARDEVDKTFPEGPIVMFALVGGWFYPLIIVLLSWCYQSFKQKKGEPLS